MDVLQVFKTTLTGLFPLFFITSSGAWLTFRGIINKPISDKLTVAISNYFTPIFCFIYISSSLEISEISRIWPILLAPLLSLVIFSILGLAFTSFLRFPQGTKYSFACVIAMPNFFMTFMLIKGICSPYGPLSNNTNCDNSFSYVSIFTFPEYFLFWTMCYSIFSLDKKNILQNPKELRLKLNGPSITNNENIWKIIKNSIFMPNPLCCLIGLAVSMVPGLKDVFFNKGIDVYSLAETLFELGRFGIIVPQMILGSNLYLIKGQESKLDNRLIICTAVFKSFGIPLVSFVIVYACWKLGVFGDDIVMTYVVFSCISAPVALAAMMITSLHGLAINEVMKVIFLNYMIAIVSLIGWTFLFFSLF